MSGTELFEGFEDFDHAQYADEAEERWGDTDAFRESQRRVRAFNREVWTNIKAEAESILERMAALMRDGGGPGSPEAMALAEEVASLPNLRLRGLMTILSRQTDPGSGYESVAQLFHQIGAALEPVHRGQWDTLSMGMSGDLESAVAEGATILRIGKAIFGPRAAAD